jgi:sugar lactone lactonase YvrE
MNHARSVVGPRAASAVAKRLRCHRAWLAVLMSLTLLFAGLTVARAQTINTIAGTGTANFFGDGRPAIEANFNVLTAITVDAAGNIFVADQGNVRIRRIDAATGLVATIAGTGTIGFNDNGGIAQGAQIAGTIAAMVTDAAGNLYFADTNNNRIRRITPAGRIDTVAGTATQGSGGDGGLATAAQLSIPQGLAIDTAGNLYIGDGGNQRVRLVNAATGVISTIAGTGTVGDSVEGVAATAATFRNITRVAVDAAGRVYVMDRDNRRVRRFSPGGTITTVAGNGTTVFSGDGGAATAAGLGNQPGDIRVDGAGTLYIADGTNRVRRIGANGIISTLAGGGADNFGNGIPATQAALAPRGLGFDRNGGLLITTNNQIRRVGGTTTPPPVSPDGFSIPAGPGLPAAAVSASTVGVPTALTVRVTLDFGQLPLQSPQAAQRFEVYVVAFVPGQLFGAPVTFAPFLQNEQRQWGPLGNPVQVFARNVDPSTLQLNRLVITLLDNFDTTLLPGTEFYIGYGVNLDDMLRAGRFRGAYKVLPP